MPNLIACRLANYGKYQERAWTHLPELGIRYVEMPVPAPADRDTLKKKLADHGLAASSLQALCTVAAPDAVEVMRPQIEACAFFGAKICFLSAKAGDTDRSVIYKRLRAIGDVAGKSGVTIALETHPDLITNGDAAAETMGAVDHPHVRINFDTANIYFYNEGRTAVEELAKVIDDVASVHLKDTSGKYQDWTFPALGLGVVDFSEIFQMMTARGFAGPFTMELEGIKGIERDEAAHLKDVADSVAYLKRIGAIRGQL